jgi:two-component system sensor histidine kinase AtoS
MSNVTSVRLNVISAWRGKIPGYVEFNAVLNLLEDAVLMVDSFRGIILAVNSPLIQLSAFTYQDLIGSPLGKLFDQPDTLPLNVESQQEIVLNRYGREGLKVILHSTLIESSSPWVLLTLIPKEIYLQNQIKTHLEEKFFHSLQKLVNLNSQPDINSSISLAIETAQSFLSTPTVCIYQALGQFPQLVRIGTSEDQGEGIFPKTLGSADFIRLRQPGIWQSGKRMISELHRCARMNNLQYLASTPLGQSGAWVGLLIAGGPETSIPERLLLKMEIIANFISAAIEHFTLINNSEKTIQALTNKLAIRKSITENAQEGIVLLDHDLTILEMNPAAELMLEYASSEVHQQPVENILIGADSLTAALQAALQFIPTPNLGNLRLHRRNGHAFPARVEITPVVSDPTPDGQDPQLLSIIIFLSDLSENEQIRVRTQQLEQRALLGELTAVFAHEVRNPLNNISTGLQLMELNFGENDQNTELVQRLQHDCSRLTHLMESVLAFSRPTQFGMELMDLGFLLQRILERWRPRLANANIQSFFQPDPNATKIKGDPRTLEQVFTNLISNAVNAMKAKGGTLAIKTSLTDNKDFPQVEITISDTGSGIPDEIRDHIFEPFVTTSPEGTGLGLAITKQIITAHRGIIKVTTFPGGTIFHILLPLNMNGEVA